MFKSHLRNRHWVAVQPVLVVFLAFLLCIAADAQSVQELEKTRDQWQKPNEIFQALGVQPGWTVADIGAGSGYFTFLLSKRVGQSGQVLAVDTNPTAITYLKQKIAEQRLRNVLTVLSNEKDPLLLSQTLDLALVVETYHEFRFPIQMLAGIRGALKRGGLLCIIDSPRSPQEKKEHAIPKEVVIEEVQANGFILEQDVPLLFPRQFMLIFRSLS